MKCAKNFNLELFIDIVIDSIQGFQAIVTDCVKILSGQDSFHF